RALGQVAGFLNFIPVCTVWCAALASAVGGYLVTGSLEVGLKAGALSALSSVVMGDIGGMDANLFAKAALGGIAGGMLSAAGGGRFGDGFLGGAAGTISGTIAPTGDLANDMIVGALAGGTVSVLGG